MDDPRARALAALDAIDRHHQGPKEPAPDAAFHELAVAMHLLYGPLPDAWMFQQDDDL